MHDGAGERKEKKWKHEGRVRKGERKVRITRGTYICTKR